jgi:hypothetical protein
MARYTRGMLGIQDDLKILLQELEKETDSDRRTKLLELITKLRMEFSKREFKRGQSGRNKGSKDKKPRKKGRWPGRKVEETVPAPEIEKDWLSAKLEEN